MNMLAGFSFCLVSEGIFQANVLRFILKKNPCRYKHILPLRAFFKRFKTRILNHVAMCCIDVVGMKFHL
jgi:hypothetical protein